MAISLFDKLRTELTSAGIEARSKDSQKWFTDRVRGIKRINEVSFLKDPNLVRKTRFFPGYMYHFTYDPKTKESLPFYDTFPLILAVAPAPGGFYGINLHYLKPLTRAIFLDKLMVIANKTEFDEKTRFKLNYSLLNGAKRFKEFAPCFKHYLTTNITSKLMMVPSQEWETAIFLPTEKFQGAKKNQVWVDSRRKILGR
jgi:hypothetical protein